MKPESLETLFLDRALGELPPETVELLDEWCAQHPAAAADGAALAAMIALARTATAGALHSPRPPLPPPRWPRRSWRLPAAESLRLAAGLALGVGLGWTLSPRHQPADTARAAPAVQPVAAPAPVAAAFTPAPSEFWSISARLAAARQAPHATVRQLNPHPFFRPYPSPPTHPRPQS